MNSGIADKIIEYQKQHSDKMADVFAELLKAYCSPSYGAMPKREWDILLFNKLREMNIISDQPSSYELITTLRVTRAKARNLIYESNLRRENVDLGEQLANLMKTVPYVENGSMVLLSIDNPLLADYIKNILAEKNYFSDGSFSPEVVRLTPEAFMQLYVHTLDKDTAKKLMDSLAQKVHVENIKDYSFQTLKTILQSFDITPKGIAETMDNLKELFSNRDALEQLTAEFMKWKRTDDKKKNKQ